MKKWIIGSFVGAILLFGWQYVSWEVLKLHKGFAHYTSAQGDILNVITANIKDEGNYMIPNVPPDASSQARKDLMKSNDGKPWASVIYHPKQSTNMAMTLIRAFLVDFVLVLLLVIILTKGGLPDKMGILTGSVAIGVITFLWGPYNGRVFYQLPWDMIRGDMIDAVVAWGLCGIWLGWWMRKGLPAS